MQERGFDKIARCDFERPRSARVRAKRKILEFLNSLVLFPPDDTASNLDPGDPNAAGFPQRGHGSTRLGALFNDPTEPE